MRKITKVLVLLALVMTLLVACGSQEDANVADAGGNASGGDAAGSEGECYDLVFWVYSDVVLNEQGRLMDEWTADFIENNDDVCSITLVPKNDSELLTSLMAGVGLPDMFFASARDGKKYRQAIDILDLTEMYESAEPGYVEGFYPDAIDTITADGGMWAVPFISYIPIIYRNLTVLEQAGIDPAEGIPSFDAFLEQLEQVQASGVDATHSWARGSWYGTGAILAADADNVTPGVEDGQTTLEADQIVRTLETVAAIDQYANNMAQWDEAAMEAFKNDELAFLLDGPWSEPGIIDSGVNYDAALVPPFEEGGRTGGMQGWDFMYGVDSGDEAKNDAIIRWLKYLGEYDQQKDWTLYVGRSTLREDVMNDPDVLVTMMAKVTAEGLQGGMKQMDFMHSNVFWASAFADVSPLVASGEITAEEGADMFIDKVNGLYAEAGE